jgi:purine nucleosidase
MRSMLARAAVTALVLLAAAPAVASARGPALIVDTDMDFDDTAALAYLGQADRLGMIDLRAVTVDISGVGLKGSGLAHARCELRKLGMPLVPTTDGDRDGVNNFPEFQRELLDGVIAGGVAPCAASTRSEGLAAELLAASVLLGGPEVDVLTLGPLTNLAEALHRYPFIASRIDHLYIEGGDTSGAEDFNLWADPSAAHEVVAALSGKITMTGPNATQHVPITTAFRNRLSADQHTTAAGIVLALATNPLIVGASDGNGAFWWDPLSAVALTVPGVVSYAPLRVSIDANGTTVPDSHGSRVSFATGADQARFENAFLNGLNGRRL